MNRKPSACPAAGRRARARGFTVLEVLIAMVIVIIGMASIIAMMSSGTIARKSGNDATAAAMLASSVFEDMSLNYGRHYYDTNRNGVPDLVEDRNNNGIEDRLDRGQGGLRPVDEMPKFPGYDYSLRVEYSLTTSREIFVTCMVFWSASGVRQSTSLQRIIFLKEDAN